MLTLITHHNKIEAFRRNRFYSSKTKSFNEKLVWVGTIYFSDLPASVKKVGRSFSYSYAKRILLNLSDDKEDKLLAEELRLDLISRMKNLLGNKLTKEQEQV